MGAIITFTTDFGLADAYVAAMKGVILGINPEANVIDVCHNVQPQNIQQAAFLLSTVYNYFPYGTIHLVVVDPEVGTNRRAIILKTPRAFFVAPDNGVLSYVLEDYNSLPVPDTRRVTVGTDLKAYVITKSEYWRKPVSDTFQGRDILAPVAARLSLGMPPFSLGENVDRVTAFPIPHPSRKENILFGNILHIDNFGNVITNIREGDLRGPGQLISMILGNQTIRGLSSTYAEGSGLVALIGSSGYLEIAMKNGNASQILKARIGDEVRVNLGNSL
jgi:S-adenosylmethionine hydrolase